MKRFWRQTIFISLSLTGAAAFWLLFPRFMPWLETSQTVSIERIANNATHILMHLGLQPKSFAVSQRILFDREQVESLLQGLQDQEEGATILRHPAIQVELQFYRPGEKPGFWGKLRQLRGNPQKESPPAVELLFNSLGHLIGLTRDTREDTLPAQSRSGRDYDRELLNHILHFTPIRSLKGMKIDSVSVFRSENSVSRSIIWTDKNDSTQHYRQVSVLFVNGSISKLSIEFVGPPRPPQSLDAGDIMSIFEGIFTATVILLVFYYLIKRLRSDLISFRTGIGLGAIAGFSLLLGLLLLHSTVESSLQLLLGIFIGAPMVALAATVLYATGESLARDLPRDRLQTMEALNRGKLFYKPIGSAILNAFVYAGFILGILTGILWLVSRFQPIFFFPKQDLFQAFATAHPWPILVLNNIQFSIFLVSAHLLFLFSVLLRWFQRPLMAGLLAALPFGLGPSIAILQVYPFSAWFIPGVVYGGLLCYLFYRTDFLTTLLTVIIMYFLTGAVLLFYFSNLIPASNYIFILGIIVVLLFDGFYIRLRGEDEIEPESLKPDYVFRLAERERLIRELEIARHIQLNFLPEETPRIPGLNIASMCVPANEVGGDYFDFIPISDRQLGIVIGDVSGKGISAAFYMTLTKGILKSLITEGQSPGRVLSRANEIFYENAKRGVFISLIYGIFDLTQKTLTFARAGHNPPIYLNQKTMKPELLTPAGLAIGLDRGPIFRETIEERSISFHPGDIFLFYTDGFSETMNRHRQEFGESRMMDLLLHEHHLSADAILAGFRQAIDTFSQGQPQHDDMTMIVVKIDDALT